MKPVTRSTASDCDRYAGKMQTKHISGHKKYVNSFKLTSYNEYIFFAHVILFASQDRLTLVDVLSGTKSFPLITTQDPCQARTRGKNVRFERVKIKNKEFNMIFVMNGKFLEKIVLFCFFLSWKCLH